MGKIIAFSNQKGGVGKTTTCVNMSAFLSVLKQSSAAFFNFLAQWITLEEGGSISVSQIILSGIVGAIISYFSGAGVNNKEALMADDNVMAATKKLKKVDYRIKNGTRYSSPEAAQFAKKNAEVLLSKTISTYKRASFESSMILYAISTFLLGLITSSDEADWVF